MTPHCQASLCHESPDELRRKIEQLEGGDVNNENFQNCGLLTPHGLPRFRVDIAD